MTGVGGQCGSREHVHHGPHPCPELSLGPGAHRGLSPSCEQYRRKHTRHKTPALPCRATCVMWQGPALPNTCPRFAHRGCSKPQSNQHQWLSCKSRREHIFYLCVCSYMCVHQEFSLVWSAEVNFRSRPLLCLRWGVSPVSQGRLICLASEL